MHISHCSEHDTTGMDYNYHQQHSPHAENKGVCFDDLTPADDGVVGGRVPVLVHLPQARGNVGYGKSHPGNGSGSEFEG